MCVCVAFSLTSMCAAPCWQVKLSGDKPARLPTQMPRGEEDGPLDHERRGLVGAVQDWAEGSKADAVKLIFSLIERLELQVGCSLPSPSFPTLSFPTSVWTG